MSISEVIVGVLLALATGVMLLCCLGVLVGNNAWARLHFIGPATIISPLGFALAIFLHEGFSQASLKAWLIALVVLCTSPILTHATGRAIYAHGKPAEEKSEER